MPNFEDIPIVGWGADAELLARLRCGVCGRLLEESVSVPLQKAVDQTERAVAALDPEDKLRVALLAWQNYKRKWLDPVGWHLRWCPRCKELSAFLVVPGARDSLKVQRRLLLRDVLPGRVPQHAIGDIQTLEVGLELGRPWVGSLTQRLVQVLDDALAHML